MSGEGPRFLDMGPPPRDPKGEFKQVYSNLLNPLFPARRSWSAGVHAGWVLGFGVLSVLSVGIVPLIYLASVRDRKRRYASLFREGAFTRGVIVSADRGELFATFEYEFEVADEIHVSFMKYAQEMTRFWGRGDLVPVLYNPQDPRQSCFVYR